MMGLLLSWVALAVVFMMIGSREGSYSAGMPMAYFFGLSLIHTPGAAIYLGFPDTDELAHWTFIGFQQTVIGLAAFLGGVQFVRHIVMSPARLNRPTTKTEDTAICDRLGFRYFLGGSCYFGLGSLISVPSLGAAVAALPSLLVVGGSLRMWAAIHEKNKLKLGVSLLLLPALPLITMIQQGFINFGMYWALSIGSFTYAQTKRRAIYFLLAPLTVYLALSVFVNYMASRTEFRQAVWFQQVGLADRLALVNDMFRNFEWLNGDSEKQRELIDGRLNQNLLVGAAVERLQSGLVDYADGATVAEMAIGLIPRALWPDKPQVGGGGTVVRTYAGMRFADTTSVGAGQVLEFYVNFGTLGVIGGFIIYGIIIGWLDLRIMECLSVGDQKAVVMWFMMCQSLMQPGGNLLEITVSVAGAAVIAYIIGHFIDRRNIVRRPTSDVSIEIGFGNRT
jgi:hypothetical protein